MTNRAKVKLNSKGAAGGRGPGSDGDPPTDCSGLEVRSTAHAPDKRVPDSILPTSKTPDPETERRSQSSSKEGAWNPHSR